MTLTRSIYKECLTAFTRPSPPASPAPIGQCSSVCSKEEMDFRGKNHLIHPLETRDPFTPKKRSERRGVPVLMVKEYSRPAADKKVHLRNVRTPDALAKAVAYVLELPGKFPEDSQWPLVYEFVADRLRAVRQDLIVQRVDGVYLLEAMIPFYVTARRRCEMLGARTYDKKLHAAQLEECCSRWFDAAEQGHAVSDEIIKLYGYLNISRPNVVYDLIRIFGDLPAGENLVKVILAYEIDDISTVLRLVAVDEGPHVVDAFWPHVGALRLRVLSNLRRACGARSVSLRTTDLASMLGFTGVEPLGECLNDLFGLKISGGGAVSLADVSLRALDCHHLGPHWFDLQVRKTGREAGCT